jgi:hypothetical protein
MHTLILQDWASIAGAATATVTQDETLWLDLAPFQDVVVYLDVRESSGTPTITFETSPAKDNSLFQTLVSSTMTAGGTPRVLRATMLGSTIPLARYLRWKITSSSGWDASFRAIVAANSPGM